ncbi:AAA family ATPase [Exiguobacterium flavidum]|uniref:AAA family ATPase n=1 Tax=Exiguobacterium flavidum TaxID=2184695 RepID=UPI000DF7FFDC|nr:SMC family ATPase [Exiguobacterium flavidum]
MRPERLTMQAFGPFSDRETIDFMKLEGRTMFVISGNTGAGKTTIFDALTFALYGETSGGEREMNDLRSHFAAETLKTEVELEFSLKGERYLIWRQPTQPHPKNKTGIAHEAVLSRYDGSDWKPLATKIPEIKAVIGELLQLDHKQFSQILLLPQNKFRELLIAESKDKLKILKQLFKTEQYGDFQFRLNRKALDLKAKIQETKTKQLAKLEELPLQASWEELTKEDILERFVQLQAEWTAKLGELRTDEAASLEVLRKTEETLRTAETIEAMFVELEQAEADIRSLNDMRPDVDRRRLKLEAALKAVRLEASHGRSKDDMATVERLTTRHSALAKELERLASDERSLSASVRFFEEAGLAIKPKEQRIERLAELIEEEDSRIRMNEELTRLKNDGQRLDPAPFKAKKGVLQQQILEWKKALATHRDVQHQLLLLKEEGFTVKQAERIAQRMEATEGELSRLVARGKQVRNEKQEAEKAYNEAIQAERAHLAVTLAESMKLGDACPVCGSLDHPHKAQASSRAKPPADALQQVYLEKHSAHQELQTNYRSLSAQLQDLEREFDDSARGLPKDAKALREQANRLNEAEKSLLEQAAEREKLERLVEEAERQTAELEQKIAATETQHQEALLEVSRLEARLVAMNRPGEEMLPVDAMKAELARLRSEISEHTEASVEAKKAHEKVTRELQLVNGQAQMIAEEMAQARSKAETSGRMFTEALESEGFADETAFLTALVPRAEREKIERDLKAYDEQLNALTREVDRLGKIALKEGRPALDSLRMELSTVRANTAQATNLRAGAEKEYDQILQLIRAWEALQQEIDAEDARYAVLGDLADAGMGGNAQRMTFETYVQTAYFDEILHAANRHLVRMTSGRFQLERKKEAGNRKKTHGLDLDVFDAYTSQTRHVKTLSGGESFKASLALALGLSEVVQEASGGVSLETMFIDEGFGTLDPESLEQAIETLLSVQASGRMVGVISHVAELKSRVDARIEVRQEKTGSTIEVVLT